MDNLNVYEGAYVLRKTCHKRPLKIDKTKVLKTDGSLMQVESIAECSREHSAILLTCVKRYFVLKNNFWSCFELLLKTGFTVFISGP